jgi:neutral ceramidase
MRASAWLALALLLGCGKERPTVTLPAPLSAPPRPQASGLLAGFGRADITPPPGVGLGGYSLENQQARGYRHRLYARAMLLEDARGERLAFVVADLPHVSALLQRRLAQRLTAAGLGIGADRLMLSATHSHSAPGNFYEARTYNQEGGRLPGFDPYLADFLVDALVQAVSSARADLAPAAAGWGTARVTGLTFNRSMDAFRLNASPITPLDGAPAESLAAVDRTLSMLRVDRCASDPGGACRPLGAFTIFAIHGTGYPAPSPLLDGDIHALVERGLERAIDAADSVVARCDSGVTALVRCDFRPRAVHLFTQGTHGDVSPALDAGTRCERLLRFRYHSRAWGPRDAPAAEEWRADPTRLARCLERARLEVERLGRALAERTIELHRSIRTSRAWELGRAAETLDLHTAGAAHELCDQPLTGTSNYAGARDGRTRLDGWKVLGLIPSGIEQGGHAISRKAQGCQGAKTIGLGWIQRLVVRRYGLPRYAQAAVFRVGNRLVGQLPGEITTEAGMRMKRAMQQAARPGDTALVVSLANGFMQYVPTEEEYGAQRYEGGSDIYGPRTARYFQGVLSTLAASLRDGPPRVALLPILADPGPTASYFRRPASGPPPAKGLRRIRAIRCEGNVVVLTWRDASPGLLAPSSGQVLEIQTRRDADSPWGHAAWDDQSEVEVRALGPTSGGYLWQVRWHAPPVSAGMLRLVLAGRPAAGLPEVVSEPLRCEQH